MRTARLIQRQGRVRFETERRDDESETVAATVNLQRTPGGSITVWVKAPDGEAGGIELDQIDRRRAGARELIAWAEEALGRRKARGGVRVELEPRNEGTFLRAKSRRREAAVNLDEIAVDARVLRWAKACLRPPARRRRPVRAWT